MRIYHEKSYYLLKYTEAAIKQTSQQINNIVGALSMQPSDTLILELNRLEEEQAQLQYQHSKLEQEIQLHRVSQDELNSLFSWAKGIISANDIDQYPELIDRCVNKVVVKSDEITIHWEMGFNVATNDFDNIPFH